MKIIADSSFNRLLGSWKTTGIMIGPEDEVDIAGSDTYELILNGRYILHRADVQMGADRSETYEIIGLDDNSAKASMYFFNANGEQGEMEAIIIGDAFHIESKELRFTGSINAANTLIRGKWYKLTAARVWTEFIDLRLERKEHVLK